MNAGQWTADGWEPGYAPMSDAQIEHEAQLYAQSQRDEESTLVSPESRRYLSELTTPDLREEIRFLERAMVTMQTMQATPQDIRYTHARYRIAMATLESR